MLEYYQKLIQDLKNKGGKEHMSISFVQSVFGMEDTNKWLKFNATTSEQMQRVQRFEDNMQKLKEKLYVPDYQSENV